MVIEISEKNSTDLIDAIVHKHNVEPGAVIPVLQEIQDVLGYVPPAAIERIGDIMDIPASDIYGIVTFYAQFRLKPQGKNIIRVCHGTACHLNGAERIGDVLAQVTGAKEGETSPDGEFTVERVACLGCCSLNPCVTINGEIHGRHTPEEIGKLVSGLKDTNKLAQVG